jgi:hypothetical protein
VDVVAVSTECVDEGDDDGGVASWSGDDGADAVCLRCANTFSAPLTLSVDGVNCANISFVYAVSSG